MVNAVQERLAPRSLWFDAFVAVVASAISVSVFVTLTVGPAADRPAQGLVLALVVAHSAALILRRIKPAVTIGIVLSSGLVVIGLGWPSVVLGLATVVVSYSAGAELRPPASKSALVAIIGSVAIGAAIADQSVDASTHVGNMAVLAVAWFIGSTTRSRRDYATTLEQRNVELEQARDVLAQQAVAQERVRIARELHDVVAHSMSVIAVHAGAGRSVIDQDPAEAKRSLAVIEETSRSALSETRRVLGLLREPDAAASVEPAPSLEGLDELLEGVRSAGVDVELHRSGEFRDVPPGQQLAIYRIVQEALTNVLKHAGARKGRVVLTRSAGRVGVEIVDDGAGSRATESEGSGLRGMKQRVDAYGGRFEAGNLAEGGFRVVASIPLEDRL